MKKGKQANRFQRAFLQTCGWLPIADGRLKLGIVSDGRLYVTQAYPDSTGQWTAGPQHGPLKPQPAFWMPLPDIQLPSPRKYFVQKDGRRIFRPPAGSHGERNYLDALKASGKKERTTTETPNFDGSASADPPKGAQE